MWFFWVLYWFCSDEEAVEILNRCVHASAYTCESYVV